MSYKQDCELKIAEIMRMPRPQDQLKALKVFATEDAMCYAEMADAGSTKPPNILRLTEALQQFSDGTRGPYPTEWQQILKAIDKVKRGWRHPESEE